MKITHFFYINNTFIEKVTMEERNALEGPITYQECLVALKNFKNCKSPGIDGFTAEFYKFFWNDLHKFLLNSFNLFVAT